jgi:hypothetical protein
MAMSSLCLVAWCLVNGMQINPDKTESIVFGAGTQLKKLDLKRTTSIAGAAVPLQDTVKIVGVTLDSGMTLDKHVSDICQSSNYHIRALRHIRPMLSSKLANELACSIVGSKLDYCNSLLANVSTTNIAKLQRVQNNLARIVCNVKARASTSSLLHKLHWLPVDKRIHFKLACMVRNVLDGNSPDYLRAAVTLYTPSRSLRSSNAGLLSIPNSANKLTIINRAFSFAAPTLWNSLSADTRLAPSYDIFKRSLKHELFCAAFPDALT